MTAFTLPEYRRLGSDVRLLGHWVTLCIIFPALTLLPTLSTNLTFAVFFPLVIIAYSGSRLATITALNANRFIFLTFWVYVYVFFGLSAFLQTAANKFPWPGQYTEGQITEAYLLVIAGFIAFDLGYWIAALNAYNIQRDLLPRRIISRIRILPISILIILASAYATEKLGGLSSLFLNRTARHHLITDSYSLPIALIFIAISRTLPYALFVVALAYRLYFRKSKLIINFLLVAIGILVLLSNNPISTPRFQVGTIFLAILFILPFNQKRSKHIVYGLIIAMVFVFPYADLFRTSNNPRSILTRLHKYEVESPLAQKVDFDSFQQVINGMLMVHKSGIDYGRQFEGALLFWIPRSVWATKPKPAGVIIAKSRHYQETNLSAPLWIEFYIDGGWILTIIGFLFYGYAAALLDESRRNLCGNIGGLSIFSTIYAGYQVYLLRGSLDPAVAYLMPVIPVIYFCTVRLPANYRVKISKISLS